MKNTNKHVKMFEEYTALQENESFADFSLDKLKSIQRKPLYTESEYTEYVNDAMRIIKLYYGKGDKKCELTFVEHDSKEVAIVERFKNEIESKGFSTKIVNCTGGGVTNPYCRRLVVSWE